MFETETMAELCLKQGLAREALAIFQRLLARTPDQTVRSRYSRRIAELTAAGAKAASSSERPNRDAAPLPQPGLRADHDGKELKLEWLLPANTRAPALQLLLLRRDESGIATECRTLPLDGAQGHLTLPLADLHSLRAAAGRMEGDRFIPLVRLDD
jgi:hypothetical protein